MGKLYLQRIKNALFKISSSGPAALNRQDEIIGRFLGGIAALIWDPETDRYLFLRRNAQRDFKAGTWDCVSGRVDQGESFEEALRREVGEEIGAEVQIEFMIATTHFYRGEKLPENELLGVIYGCTLRRPYQIRLGEEHSEMRWVTAAEADMLLDEYDWLRIIVHKAERLKSLLPVTLRTHFRREGFEI